MSLISQQSSHTTMHPDTTSYMRDFCRAIAVLLVVLPALTGCVTVKCYTDTDVSDEKQVLNFDGEAPCSQEENALLVQRTADL